MARLLFSTMPFVLSLSASLQGLRHRIADPYRPERYYMRGPGPKVRAKQGA